MGMVASVAILRGVRDLYTYEIPDSLSAAGPGTPVTVPLGASIAPGVIIRLEPVGGSPIQLKSIIAIDPKRPTIRPDQLALIEWFISHYLTTPDKAIQTIVGNHRLRAVAPSSASDPEVSLLTLSSLQVRTVDAIISQVGYKEFLIHGVTGSGKTEIYLEIARQMKIAGKSAIVLVPEISLTPQVSRIFQSRLGTNVAILHSGLTAKQRTTTWNQIYSGEIQVVIGPRSAIFSPLHNLGVIIVDECHDGSYKQDQHPRYDTLQVAKKRAEIAQIPLVYGSATPTLEQMFYARAGTTQLLSLPHRIMNRPMATHHISDIRDRDLFPDDSVIGRPLADALRIASAKGEKAIVLVNRRGYAPTIMCQKCRNPVTCPQCELGYTYHSDRILRCHRCFTQTPLPLRCPSCKKGSLAIAGAAIQKVEFELRKLLPESSILRLDRDTGTHANRISEIMDEFRDSGDILIGTQMIAKGHDIPLVTVVGIVGIDASLGIPDFRAGERAFQLITQVAGRAGRGELPGDVYIQTAKPGHYAIASALDHDFDRFYTTELGFRKPLRYPPFTELINIIISGAKPDGVSLWARTIHALLTDSLDPHGFFVMPAQPAPVAMIKGQTRWHILVKTMPHHTDEVRDILRKIPPPQRGIRVIVDFDPQSIL